LRCALAGAKVAVFDAGFDGQASAAGAGIVSPVGLGGDEASQEWSTLVASAISHYERTLDLLKDAGIAEVGFARAGEIVVATREQDGPRLDELAVRLEAFSRSGIPVGRIERLTGSGLTQLWPELRKDLDGIFIENVARMDGRRMCAALADLAKRRGATFSHGRADIKLNSDHRCSLHVDGAPISAGVTVLAAGAWSLPTLRELGVRIEVHPVRGQILHLELSGTRTGTRPVVNTFEGHYFLGFPESRVVTGGTHEPEAAFDCRVTAGGVHSLLEKALRIAPGLAAGTLVETRVGLRPRSTDGYPIVGRPDSAENIVVATGLGAWGLTLGPLIGEIAAEQALGLSPSFAADFLGPDREAIATSAVLSPNLQ
jgi:D-amino-acid dehydrogenase